MQASALPAQSSSLLNLPGELRMKTYKFAFAGSELIVRGRPYWVCDKWRQGMRDWEHAWYSFHDVRRPEEDLEASRYPMALTQASVLLRRETQPVLAAATCLLATDVDARVALSMIPPHIKEHIRSITIFGRGHVSYARQVLTDNSDPLMVPDLPRLEQVITHEIHEHAYGPYLDEMVKAEFQSLEHFMDLKRRHLCPRQLSASKRLSEHPFVGLRAMAERASLSSKRVVHILGVWPGPNYPHHDDVEVLACLVSTNLNQSIICV